MAVPCQVPVPIVPIDVICVCAASILITELAAVNPVPANNVATSAIASFFAAEVAPPSRNVI